MDIQKKWQVLPMTEVVKWGSGGTPKATVKEYYDNGSIPWLVIGDLNDGIVTTSATKITPLGLKNSSAKIVPANTLLVAMYGSIGKLGITGMECCTNQAIAFAKELVGVTTKYMYYFMMSRRNELIERGKGGTQKNISQTVLNSMNVPVPPLPEQQRIVAKIEELFAELDNSVAMLKKVKEQLEVYSKSIYSHLILSNVEKVMVKDICNEIHIGPFGSTLHKVDYVVNGVPVINPSNIKNQQIIPDSRLSVTEKKAQELSSYKLQVGDIIMGRRGEMGRCAPVTKKENGYICGTGSLFFRLKPEYDNVLYSQILASQEVVSFLMEKAVGTTMKNLNEDIVSRILVPKITKSAGNKILETMQDTTKKCSDISCKLNQMEQQTDALRQSILKKAFEEELL